MPSLVDFRHRANTEVNIYQGHSTLCSSAWIITGRKITAIFIKYQSFRNKIPHQKTLLPGELADCFTWLTMKV